MTTGAQTEGLKFFEKKREKTLKYFLPLLATMLAGWLLDGMAEGEDSFFLLLPRVCSSTKPPKDDQFQDLEDRQVWRARKSKRSCPCFFLWSSTHDAN